MKRRTLLKTSAIAAGAIVLPTPATPMLPVEAGRPTYPYDEGDLVMVKLEEGELPGVCTTIDGECVNVTLFDGTVCPAHRPCDDFRPPTPEEWEAHEMALMTEGLVTVTIDGDDGAFSMNLYRLAELPKPITPVIARRMVDHIRSGGRCCDNVALETLDGSQKLSVRRDQITEFQT